ncbi:hypothetical protein SISSUDRAFT_1068243 [Sistotremastrum suecicum HHB10207 ss-3]|uniref:Uncharacterized protein n=1 Tax=Sistotremastrum suecicum HHB10207 ss-3 TaxID=1314776 RepID=A0A165WD80_9AGAM|nr:hypothetical protein SISSUDRAFT_1068243 [Sistotremastrum suecicum HHB10207 ss-3]
MPLAYPAHPGMNPPGGHFVNHNIPDPTPAPQPIYANTAAPSSGHPDIETITLDPHLYPTVNKCVIEALLKHHNVPGWQSDGAHYHESVVAPKFIRRMVELGHFVRVLRAVGLEPWGLVHNEAPAPEHPGVIIFRTHDHPGVREAFPGLPPVIRLSLSCFLFYFDYLGIEYNRVLNANNWALLISQVDFATVFATPPYVEYGQLPPEFI